MAIIFKKLTHEEQNISNDFFELCERVYPDDEVSQEKFNKFFGLFIELCHQRDFNPEQLKLEFEENK